VIARLNGSLRKSWFIWIPLLASFAAFRYALGWPTLPPCDAEPRLRSAGLLLQLIGLVASGVGARDALIALKGALRPPIIGGLNQIFEPASAGATATAGFAPDVRVQPPSTDRQRLEAKVMDLDARVTELEASLAGEANRRAESDAAERSNTERRFEEWATRVRHDGRVIALGLVLAAFGAIFATVPDWLANTFGCG